MAGELPAIQQAVGPRNKRTATKTQVDIRAAVREKANCSQLQPKDAE